MSEHGKDRTPPPAAPEKFFINDAIVGKSFAVRDCTDEQLQRAFKEASQQHETAVKQLGSVLQVVQNSTSVCSMLAYEMDRRSRPAIKIADIADINRIRNGY
jgi:hypothetical protein